ncbi:hypothetical protein PAXRUDRAFT_793996, partial [Paxillus rubicundulus Ve08.2h10]
LTRPSISDGLLHRTGFFLPRNLSLTPLTNASRTYLRIRISLISAPFVCSNSSQANLANRWNVPSQNTTWAVLMNALPSLMSDDLQGPPQMPLSVKANISVSLELFTMRLSSCEVFRNQVPRYFGRTGFASTKRTLTSVAIKCS